MERVLHNPGTVFALCFLCTYLLYKIGASMAAAGTPSKGKEEIYACGEQVEGKVTPAYGWFRIAFIFTLLDVAVLLVATVPKDVSLPLALAWLVGGAAAILMMLKD